MLEMKHKLSDWFAISVYFIVIFVPIILAIDRLIWVAGFDPIAWFSSLEKNFISQGVIGFTIIQAILSTLLTVVIGIPIAWQLGRYKWRYESLIKAILTMPFVMPSIIVAMGFLQIIGSNGLDIRDDNSTWLITLIIAHAWFNLALVIRFCEPVLSNLSPEYLDQLKLLPEGRNALSRARLLWIPILYPSIIAAACMTFVFSFTSFALVKWITIGDNTLESMMAGLGMSAGISDYMISHNQIIISASIIQFCVLAIALYIVTKIQQKRQTRLEISSQKFVKSENKKGWFVLAPAIFFALTPLIVVFISSFRIRNVGAPGENYSWSFGAWNYAFSNSNSLSSASEAILNSLGYAFTTVLFAIPIGWFLASSIVKIEKSNRRLARILDFFVMIPFAISSVMIGLGVMIGMIKINPEFFYSIWITPVLAHVMITTPFVVRILLSSQRTLPIEYEEAGMVLGMNSWQRFSKIRLPLMKHSLFIAIIFTIAISLGEFGASWVVTRNSEWTTLPILIDSLKGIPYNNSLTTPAASAVASILMILTIIIFTVSEKFRKSTNRGMF